MRIIAILLSVALSGATAPSTEAIREKERGDRLAANGDVAGAREAYENALTLSPGYAMALNEIGILLVGQDKKDEAVAFFKRAIAADPSFALAQNNLGFVLRKLDRFSDAVEAYQSYLLLAPNDAAGRYGLAEAYKGAGDKPNALKNFERYLAMDGDPKNQKRIDRARGFAETLRGELGVAAPEPAAAPTAVVVAATPAATTPTAPVATATVATATVATAPAKAAYTPVEVSADRVAKGAQKLTDGLSLRAAGDTRASLFAFQDATNADPSNARAVLELGVAYAMLNYFPQAVERWERVLLMPADAAVRSAAEQNLEKARQKMGVAPSTPASAVAPAASVVASPTPASTSSSSTSAATGPPASSSAPATAPAPAPGASASEAPAAAAPTSPAATPNENYARGVDLYSQRNFREALKLFDAAIQGRAEFPQAFTARGSVNFALGDYSRALADYSQAMRLDNTMGSPVFGVAEALTAVGRKAEAIPYYRAYVDMRSPDANAQLQDVARKRIADAQ